MMQINITPNSKNYLIRVLERYEFYLSNDKISMVDYLYELDRINEARSFLEDKSLKINELIDFDLM